MKAKLTRGELSKAGVAGAVRVNARADTKPDGAGIWTGEKNPPVLLRLPGPAAGAGQRGGETDWSAEYNA